MNAKAPIGEGNAAARSGDIARLRAWLQAGNDPNKYDTQGWTPLLWASVRGHHEAIELLLDNGADIAMPHRESRALPVHMAGQCGDVRSSEILLNRRPDHLDAVLDINGHTILLQAVFYGHLDLAAFLLKKGADTSITTARGLGPMELAAQFQNRAMMDIVRPYDSPAEAKAAYYKSYLARIAPVIPESGKGRQEISDQLVAVIENGLKKAAADPGSVESTLAAVRDFIENRKADVNRLGGPLQQPPLIVAATGNNGFPPNPDVARLRNELAKYLLEKGADPALREKHPMAVQTIIRAAVFNHLDILKMCAKYLTPQKLADAINEVPVVNGLTAMHDTVLRATMADPAHFEGYLEQARWFTANGGRSDMEEYSGVTQRDIALRAKDENVRRRLIEALGG